MAFPDPSVPIATCQASECSQCTVASSIHCHFRPADLAHFLLISLPPFLVGGAAVLALGTTPLLVWIVVILAFFGFVEIRVLCSQCMKFACPLNSVPASTRALFFLRNPSVAKAWEE